MQIDEAMKIYNKALQMTIDYIPSNKQLVRNLGRVVNSIAQEHQISKQPAEPRGHPRELKEESTENRYTPSSRAGNSTRFALRNRSSVDSENVHVSLMQGSSFIESSFSRQ